MATSMSLVAAGIPSGVANAATQCAAAVVAKWPSAEGFCGERLAVSHVTSVRALTSRSSNLPSSFEATARVVRLNKAFVRSQTAATGAAPAATTAAPAITLTDGALRHLLKLKKDQSKEDLCLRVGVRQGGCSGMSYIMDFEERANIRAEDAVIDYEGFTMVCDPKSLLYLFGMQLDHSNALIGGGFSFSNPNASSTCGCGKSFAA